MVAARQHHVVPYLAANLDRLDIPGQARSELEAAAGRQHAGAAVLAADLSVALDGASRRRRAGTGVQGRGAGGAGLRGLRDSRGGRPRPARCPGGPRARPRALLTTPAGRRPPATPCPGRRGRGVTSSGPATSSPSRRPHSDIDLHWHLVPTRGTFPDFDTLWSRRAGRDGRGHPIAHPVAVRRADPFGRTCRQGRMALVAQPARRARAHVATATRGSAPTGRSAATSCFASGWPFASSARRRRCHRSSATQPSRQSTSCCERVHPRSGGDGARAPTLRRPGHQLPASGCEAASRTDASPREVARLSAGAPCRRGSPPTSPRRTPCVAAPRVVDDAVADAN